MRQRSTRNISTRPGARRILPSPNILTPKAEASSIALRARRQWAGSKLRRKPLQDSPTPGANSSAAILLDRLYGYTGDARYRDCAEATLEAFAGIAPQFGIHAASYGLAALLHARRPFEVVITGASDDPQAAALERAANSVYRFGKAVLARYARNEWRAGCARARVGRNAAAPSRRGRASAGLRGHVVPPARHRSCRARRPADAKAGRAFRRLKRKS